MQCFVYRSTLRTDTYVYLPREDDFDDIPESLRQRLGRLEFALAFDLAPDRTMARADPRVVMAQLDECGYYLQLPPGEWRSS